MIGSLKKYLTPLILLLAVCTVLIIAAHTAHILSLARAEETATVSEAEAPLEKQQTAEEETAAAVEQQLAPSPTLWQVLKTGGLVMLILFIISIITVALIVYYFLALTLGNLMPQGFIDRLQDILNKGRFDEAGMFCRQNRNPFARVVEVGIEASPRGHEIITESINSEGARQASSLWQKISYLNDIAIIAPMLGLLGTVIGMLDSFLAIHYRGGTAVGTINPAALANGVAKALITTVAGLIVGIIATIAYAYFRGAVQRIVVAMEARGAQIADIIEKGARTKS